MLEATEGCFVRPSRLGRPSHRGRIGVRNPTSHPQSAYHRQLRVRRASAIGRRRIGTSHGALGAPTLDDADHHLSRGAAQSIRALSIKVLPCWPQDRSAETLDRASDVRKPPTSATGTVRSSEAASRSDAGSPLNSMDEDRSGRRRARGRRFAPPRSDEPRTGLVLDRADGRSTLASRNSGAESFPWTGKGGESSGCRVSACGLGAADRLAWLIRPLPFPPCPRMG
jgi:hypothetical protein